MAGSACAHWNSLLRRPALCLPLPALPCPALPWHLQLPPSPSWLLLGAKDWLCLLLKEPPFGGCPAAGDPTIPDLTQWVFLADASIPTPSSAPPIEQRPAAAAAQQQQQQQVPAVRRQPAGPARSAEAAPEQGRKRKLEACQEGQQEQQEGQQGQATADGAPGEGPEACAEPPGAGATLEPAAPPAAAQQAATAAAAAAAPAGHAEARAAPGQGEETPMVMKPPVPLPAAGAAAAAAGGGGGPTATEAAAAAAPEAPAAEAAAAAMAEDDAAAEAPAAAPAPPAAAFDPARPWLLAVALTGPPEAIDWLDPAADTGAVFIFRCGAGPAGRVEGGTIRRHCMPVCMGRELRRRSCVYGLLERRCSLSHRPAACQPDCLHQQALSHSLAAGWASGTRSLPTPSLTCSLAGSTGT